MKTNKKAGILVGVVLFALAIGVYWIAKDRGSNEEPQKIAVASQPVASAPAKTAQPEKTEVKTPTESSGATASGGSAVSTPVTTATPEPAAEPKVVVPDVDQYTNGVKGTTGTNEKTAITVLNEGDLGKPSQDIMAPMVVIAKNVVLLDQDQTQSTGKQLVYMLNLTGGSTLKLSLYVNGTAYNGLEIGDKLNITYKVYKNKEGVQFPIVVSAETPTK